MLVLLAVVGIGNTIVDVSGMTLLQRSAPDEVLARVFGVLESVLLLSVALGAIAAPLLVNWLGTRGALIVAGSLLPLVVIPAWPMLNAIDRAAEVPVERLELLRANPIFRAVARVDARTACRRARGGACPGRVRRSCGKASRATVSI